MSDPYAETDEWPTPSLSARPATHSPEQPVSGSTVTGDAEGAREARYAQAIWPGGMMHAGTIGGAHQRCTLRAVMAVADEEQAALRAEVERLRVELAVQSESDNRLLDQAAGLLLAAEDRLRSLREAALLACSALDKHPDHADTCEHALNPEDECTCWRREVYAASVELAVLAAPPAAPEAAEAACEHPYRDVAQEVIGGPPVLACNRCGHTLPAPAPVSSGEAGTGEADDPWVAEETKHGTIHRCRHCKGVNDWTGHQTDCPVYRAAVARSQAARGITPAPVVAPSAEGGE